MRALSPYRIATDVEPEKSPVNPGSSSESASRFSLDRSALSSRPSAVDNGIYLRPVSTAGILLTLNQLAVMTQNGLELAEALEHVSAQSSDPRLRASLLAIHDAVSSGSTFSSAVATYGQHFPSTLPAMLAAAEATGEVPETLAIVCQRMRDELDLRSSIIGAMIYPIILVSASAVVMTALMLGVLPQFGRVFESMGKPVPYSTRLLIDIGNFGAQHWMYLFPPIIASLIALVVGRKHPLIQRPIGKLLLYCPMIKDAFRPLMAGRHFRTIAAMVRGGVPLLQAVQLTRKTVSDRSWRELLLRVESHLIDGMRASAALAYFDFLPPEATQMMATGERTGRVAEVLEDIGRFYEQEGGRRLRRLVITLEPAIILFMGLIVAGVVMSVLLPLLDISTVQR